MICRALEHAGIEFIAEPAERQASGAAMTITGA